MNEIRIYDEVIVEELLKGDNVILGEDHVILTADPEPLDDEAKDGYLVVGHSEDTDLDVEHELPWDDVVPLWTYYDPTDYDPEA